ncbi:hypothetical protein QA596_05425 [Balneolales bacterium ANBcel1]|nr:hypothetical protein [Balneolales bacterium ANBcel1]
MTPLLATLIALAILLLILPIGLIQDYTRHRKSIVETDTDYDGMGTFSRYMRR